MNKYIAFWAWLGAIIWPIFSIYAALLPPTPNNPIQIAFNSFEWYYKILYVITSPLQGAFLGLIIGGILTAIIGVTLWDSLIKPLVKKLYT